MNLYMTCLKSTWFKFHNNIHLVDKYLHKESFDREESYKLSTGKYKWNAFSQTNLEKGMQKNSYVVIKTQYITFKLF